MPPEPPAPSMVPKLFRISVEPDGRAEPSKAGDAVDEDPKTTPEDTVTMIAVGVVPFHPPEAAIARDFTLAFCALDEMTTEMAFWAEIVKACVEVPPYSSEACTTKDEVPVAVGVPVIAPLEAKDNPVGSVPDARDHEMASPLASLAASVCEYAAPR